MTVILFDLINNHISSLSRGGASSGAMKENLVWVTLGRRTCGGSSVTSRLSQSTEVTQAITSGNSLVRSPKNGGNGAFRALQLSIISDRCDSLIAAVSKQNQPRPA